jgi:hypothetical protein
MSTQQEMTPHSPARKPDGRAQNTRFGFAASDFVSIRGTRLAWSELVDPRLFDADYRQGLRQQLLNATPFEHLVVDGWFHPELLRLVREEFDLYPFEDRRDLDRKYENTYRSPRCPLLGPAAQVYFGLVNAGWFTELLTEITQVEQLIADPTLHNAGLHESRRGGKFSIHRDFERSECSELCNEMVLLTYLCEDWNPAWNGALELWDASRSQCVRRIEPELGRSVLMRNGPTSYHGHSAEMLIPEGQARRSLASYYYTHSAASKADRRSTASRYLFALPSDRMKWFAKDVTPPVVWRALKRVLR